MEVREGGSSPISYFQAIALGLIQGFAEPFPISSLGLIFTVAFAL
jgi:undecaprenyl pyrophosphate phosphatase UppP